MREQTEPSNWKDDALRAGAVLAAAHDLAEDVRHAIAPRFFRHLSANARR
jgi:hypothetical protein